MSHLTPSATACIYAARPYPKALGQGSENDRMARLDPPPPNALGGLRGVSALWSKGEVE